jgi:hypothetical protein
VDPVFAMLANGISPPDFLCLLASTLFDKTSAAGKRPILPLLNITVGHRIVMNVIQCRPEMPVRFHSRFGAIKPGLAPSPVVFTIPVTGDWAE